MSEGSPSSSNGEPELKRFKSELDSSTSSTTETENCNLESPICDTPAAKKFKSSESFKTDQVLLPEEIKAVTNENGEDDEVKSSLLSLSDDVLLIILAFLNKRDLVSLANCSQRLFDVCRDHSLWHRVDLSARPLTLNSFKTYLKFLTRTTKYFCSHGPRTGRNSRPVSLNKYCFTTLAKKAPNLQTLILKNHIWDAEEVALEDFPQGLETLKLLCCDIRNRPTNKSYLFEMDKLFPKLKVLDFHSSPWFLSHSLLALSKIKTLQVLRLENCNLADCLTYISLASQYGFFALETLDLRKTKISDVEVTCFNRGVNLKHLYLSPAKGASRAITDQCLLNFGGPSRMLDRINIIDIGDNVHIMDARAVPRPPCNLETLVIQNYIYVTDISLLHAAQCFRKLKYLDVTGTGISGRGLIEFKKLRPEVEIVPDIG